MKNTHRIAALLALSLALAAVAADRSARWKEVDDAMNKGLPKTAIEKLDPIIREAIAEKAWGEAVKAIGRKIALEGNIEGNKPEERILRLEAEMAKAPAEMKPLMHAILGHWYWQFFEHNRWRFLQRTPTAEPPGADILTWDLARILSEIDRQFSAALSDEKSLQAQPIALFEALLTKATMPDACRPTLFDFLAHEALKFYQAGEQAGAKAADAFVLEAESPIFGTTDEFLRWVPDTGDEVSPLFKGVKLLQKLVAFHRNDREPTALLDAELARLSFAKEQSVGEAKTARAIAAYRRIAEEWADHEASALARHVWATLLREEGDFVEARKVAQQGAGAHPRSPGGRLCANLVKEIEALELAISTERVWNAPWPAIEVAYRNANKVWFRAIPQDYEALLKRRTWSPESVDDDLRKALLAAAPAQAWSAALPPTPDYQTRVEATAVPQDLKPGFYFVLASLREDFREGDNIISAAPVWVSDLALVTRSRMNDNLLDGFVLRAGGGEPVAGASVQVWTRDQRRDVFALSETVATDVQGRFGIRRAGERSVRLLVRHEAHQVASGDFWLQRGQNRDAQERTVFFTDRSLYRPGQTIQYKGICLLADRDNDNYQTLADRTVTVVFTDPNGKEIEKRTHKTNAYGAFSGSFTAPRDRLTGQMTIAVPEGARGMTTVNVEEYKRPKFRVELDAPKEAAKLDARVELTGRATAYTGAAIGNAKVVWRVRREVRYPDWWRWMHWWWPLPQGEAQEIAQGTATTAPDGSFSIAFTARPDRSVPEKDEPTFTFSVNADVTDATGETRSASRDLNAGYTALLATMTASEWQETGKPVEVTVKTTTLDGDGQTARGRVQIFALKQPEKVARPRLTHREPRPFRRGGPAGAATPKPEPDLSNPDSWELGEEVAARDFETDAAGSQKLAFDLKPGIYRALLESRDRFGKPVKALLPITVVDVKARAFPFRVPNYVAAPAWTLEPGQSLLALWGTGYETGRAYIEVEHRGKILKAFWTEAGRTQEAYEHAITEEMRGGFTFRVTYVRENRAYISEHRVDVPWSNKKFEVKWERFVSKLEPGQKVTWTAVITGPDARRAAAEMVAALYDASLDAYAPHDWLREFGVFRQDSTRTHSQFENRAASFDYIAGRWRLALDAVPVTYREFPGDIVGVRFGGGPGRGAMLRSGAPPPAPPEMADAAAAGEKLSNMAARRAVHKGGAGGVPGSAEEPPAPDLSKVSPRTNLNETAFFFPLLTSDEQGVVRLEFTMPEALTEWRFIGFAHDRELRSGYLEGKAVTAKDLMVEPNPPRFVREGDEIEFTVKVSNQSAAVQRGLVRLGFSDARTLAAVNEALGLKTLEQSFDIPSKESKTFSWRIRVPDGMGFLTYKAVGSSGRLSDGEEGYLPVLSRRVLVTESLPLPIRGKGEKEFRFAKLAEAAKSNTLRHQSLTVQMASQPAWYAVMALPYLMEFPHECVEQTFNRFYANALARYIAESDPKIRRVFDQWKGTPALDSPLEKNANLKAVALAETPWVRQAESESQARRNVGVLFDQNRLNDETARLWSKVAEAQYEDGRWPWFPGGPGNDYITLYITTGFGRLRHLGVKNLDVAPALKSLARLDAWLTELYREIVKHDRKNENNLSPHIAFFLYGRSFFLADRAVEAGAREAFDYFLGQARQYWLQLGHRQSQAHLAIALKRFGDADTARVIMASIKERSVSNEEMGMFWRDTEFSWWWYRAPIETQAMMIEAFDEVMADAKAVEDCRVWLLKQKQTQDWKTTKATADAVYALLLRGTSLLASDALVQVSLGGTPIEPKNVEAGTGFYEQRFAGPDVKPAQAAIRLVKTDDGVAWGGIHWQYLEDVAKVTPHTDTPLKLSKRLFVKVHTARGPELRPVQGPIAVGDELVTRVEIRTDRDLEYVHLKDARGSGTEPVNVLSRYKYQDGLAYYESTKDTATHFFIDYLPKGVYVFEYSVRVQHRGAYQSGMAEIQCMYAPEFNSHSESIAIEVR